MASINTDIITLMVSHMYYMLTFKREPFKNNQNLDHIFVISFAIYTSCCKGCYYYLIHAITNIQSR